MAMSSTDYAITPATGPPLLPLPLLDSEGLYQIRLLIDSIQQRERAPQHDHLHRK